MSRGVLHRPREGKPETRNGMFTAYGGEVEVQHMRPGDVISSERSGEGFVGTNPDESS